MTKEKNILITTTNETKDRLDIRYYACDNAAGMSSYTTGIATAEAGIKYMLSRYRIDEVIVLGPPVSAAEEEKERTRLADIYINGIADLYGMSEYAFLCYRVSEYLHQMDFELLDIGELPEEEKAQLEKKLAAFRAAHAGLPGLKELFAELCGDETLARAFEEEVLAGSTPAQAKWLKHTVYSKMDSFLKLHLLPENQDTEIRFMPIVGAEGGLDIRAITEIVEQTLEERAQHTNLYLDLQGLGTTDANTLISTFMLLSRRVGYDCTLQGLIHSTHTPGDFAGRVMDVKGSYEIQRLLSGIDLFLDHGKVQELHTYWDALGIEDPDAPRLFAAMNCVDEGVALCNVDLIAGGIDAIHTHRGQEYLYEGADRCDH